LVFYLNISSYRGTVTLCKNNSAAEVYAVVLG
jgi:hypothetical protein